MPQSGARDAGVFAKLLLKTLLCRGLLDVLAQQLCALHEMEETQKTEKNVVLEKVEQARVELLAAIDGALPQISHEQAVVQAALDFVELPDDRNKLSPRYSSSQELGDDVTTDRVSGGGNVELNSFRVRESQTSNTEGANQLISSLARTRQQSVQKSVENAAGHSGSSASTPQNLFSRYATALKQSL